MNLGFIYVTAPNIKVAKKISRQLLKIQLIACSNIFPKINSLFTWNGKLEETQEVAMFLKSKKSNFNQIKNEIIKLHPYKCPCVALINIEKINLEYGNWLKGI